MALKGSSFLKDVLVTTIQSTALIIFSIFWGFQNSASAATAACTQTVSVGASISNLVATASNGSVICLNAGNYGAVNFSNISRTGTVTLQSASGVSAQMAPTVTNSDFLRFESMTLRDMTIESCSTNIQVVGNTWVSGSKGIVLWDYQRGCSSANKNILIDGNTFIGVNRAHNEGMIALVEIHGVTISNNLIQGPMIGDGIQTNGTNNNITVGPGNIFRNITQSPCNLTGDLSKDPHCDSIQLVGGGANFIIDGNWFDHVEVTLQHHDGTAPIRFTNNLIVSSVQMWVYDSVANNSVIEHNTFYGQQGIFWGQNGSGVTTSSGMSIRSNILIGGSSPNVCSGCTVSHNLGGTSGQAPGTNALIGSPVFVGGSAGSISSYQGYKLTTGSIGTGSGHDGKDRGILTTCSTGDCPASAPMPPANLRIQ